MSLVVILLILLLIGGVGAGPWWGYSAGYGYGPSGIIGHLGSDVHPNTPCRIRKKAIRTTSAERPATRLQKFHEAVARALEAVERGEVRSSSSACRRGTARPSWPPSASRPGSWASTRSRTSPSRPTATRWPRTWAPTCAPSCRRRSSSRSSRPSSCAAAAREEQHPDREGRPAVFVGRGGALTGRGAHLLLIDDLYKDHEEARSQAVRDQAWNWFTKVAMTRRMGKKLVVITMTRWHSDDIIGRLTDPENPNYNAIEAKKWKIIRLPAIAEDDDPLGRKPGRSAVAGTLRPRLHGEPAAARPARLRGAVPAAADVADGTLFRARTSALRSPSCRRTCASTRVRPCGRHKQRNDPSCFGKAGIDQRTTSTCRPVLEAGADGPAVEAMLAMGSGKNRPLVWWAERGHISKSIGPFLRKRMLETGHLHQHGRSDAGRRQGTARAVDRRACRHGQGLHPDGPQWAERAIDEMLAFPNGTA
jgi:hypothetical protein